MRLLQKILLIVVPALLTSPGVIFYNLLLFKMNTIQHRQAVLNLLIVFLLITFYLCAIIINSKMNNNKKSTKQSNNLLNKGMYYYFLGEWTNTYTYPGQNPQTELFEIRDGNKYFVSGVHKYNIIHFDNNAFCSGISFVKESVTGNHEQKKCVLARNNWGLYKGTENDAIKVVYERIGQ